MRLSALQQMRRHSSLRHSPMDQFGSHGGLNANENEYRAGGEFDGVWFTAVLTHPHSRGGS